MKHTKHKLLSSIATLFVCLAMFIGSTYAWFTDSASTGVNKIQAGNLDIKVEYLSDFSNGTWSEIDVDKKLFNDDALWEPGHAEIAYLKITNDGNLHLKYKLSVDPHDVVIGTSVNGTSIDLSTILKFGKIESSDAPTPYSKDSTGRQQAISAVSNSASSLLSYTKENLDLAPGTSEYVTLVVYMPTEIGNEANYRGDSVPSIKLGVNVVATQTTNESDSFDNQYDKDALYPILAPVINNTTGKELTLDENGKTSSQAIVITDNKATSTVPASTLLYGADGTTAVATNDNGKLNREIKTTESSSDSVTYDISYTYIAANGTSMNVTKFGNVIENVIDVSTGLSIVKVTHSHDSVTTVMTLAQNANEKEDGTYYYDSQNGKIYVWSSEYSSFKVEYETDFVAATNGQGYGTLKEAMNIANNSSQSMTVTLLKDVELDENLQIGSGTTGVNLNLNKKTLNGGSYQVFTAGEGTSEIFGDGVITNSNQTQNADYAPLRIYGYSNVILNGVTVDGNYCGVKNSGNLTVIKASILGNTFGIGCFGDGTTVIGEIGGDNNDVKVVASEQALGTAAATALQGMIVTINSGTFKSSGTVWDDCPLYWASHGTLNVYGGIFKNWIPGTEAAGILQKNGTVNIYGGEFDARDGIKIVAQDNSTEIITNINGGEYVGYRSGIYVDASKSDYMNRLSAYSVKIQNSENSVPVFHAGEEGSIYAKTGGLGDKKLMLISGGEFNDDPSEYVVEGKMAVLSDGVYLVVNDTRVKTEEQLKAAVEKGGEFALGADIQLTSSLYISKDITMNLDSFKITGLTKNPAIVLKSDGAPVKVLVNATTGGVSASGSNGDCFEMPHYNDSTAELTINGGTYTSDNGYFVDINSGSSSPETRKDKLYINGCTYTGANIINANPANTEIVMTSGNLTGMSKGIVLGTKSTNTKFTMAGGSITYESGAVITAQASGNTIDISDDATVTGQLSLTNCTMNIHGGTVNITGINNRALMMNNGATLNISDTAKVNGDPLFNMNGGSVNITGGSFKGKIVNGLNYGNASLKSVKDLLIDDYYLSEADSDGWYQVIQS